MSKRIGVSAVVALLVFPFLSFAQTVSTRSDFVGTAAQSRRASRETAVPFLRKTVESINWEEKPFEEIIDWLRDEADGRVNILPRWNALSANSIDQDAFVTMRLINTTIGEVLTELLLELSEDDSLAFRASGNKLRISTKDDFDRKLEVRVYDVTDIVFRVPDMGQGAPRIDLQQQTGSSGGGGGGQSVFGGGGGGGGGQEQGGRQAEQEAEERVQELVEMITLTIAPGTWRTGGSANNPQARGSIVARNRQLIVTHTIEVHEQIAGSFVRGNH